MKTCLLVLSLLILGACGLADRPQTFTNPLKKKDGSDPFMVYDNGYYYLMTTTWKDVQLTRAKSVNGLKTGETKVVYKDGNKNRCCNVWAPEIHQLDGTWYIYFTAGQDKDLGFQRMHVLRGGKSPWGSYAYAGQLVNDWSIDGTVAKIGNRRFLYWSCQRDSLQSLCGAEMESPTKLKGGTHLISQPKQSWERHGKFPVNEGPELLEHNGRTFLVYSASYCWTPQYSLGVLSLKKGGNPLDKGSWSKSGPLMTSANGNFGPGHNGFFKSPNGKEIWNVYHATANPKGACDGNRYTMVGSVNWTADGMPILGQPPPLGTTLFGPSD